MRIVGRADRTYIVGRQLRFLASLHVDGLRHCFKMLDVHAGWVAAEMIDYQAVRSHDEPTCVIAFDIRRLAATAFAQLRSRIFVHAASLIEVVNGSAGLTACAPSILVRNAA